MNRKKENVLRYESPSVLSVHPVCTERGILQTSVVENIEAVETIGHEVHNYDFSPGQNTFNHEWQ